MTTSIKQLGTNLGLGFVALGLSSIAAAGSQGGTIIFTAAPPALPVPTFGVMAAVILASLFGVMALRTLHKNRQTFASIALVSATLGAALIVASAGIVRAVGEYSVGADDLDQSLPFDCSNISQETINIFRNNTGSGIKFVEINEGGCTVNMSSSTCAARGSGTITQNGQTCTVVAEYNPG